MTPDLINMRVATWLGWTNIQQSRRHQGRIVGNAPERFELTVIPDYYHTNASQDLLKTLVAKEYVPSVEYLEHMQEWEVAICRKGDNEAVLVVVRLTELSEAICHAVLELDKREGE